MAAGGEGVGRIADAATRPRVWASEGMLKFKALSPKPASDAAHSGLCPLRKPAPGARGIETAERRRATPFLARRARHPAGGLAAAGKKSEPDRRRRRAQNLLLPEKKPTISA